MRGYSWVAGVHVVGTSIWCDAARAGAVCFVSRADVDLGRGRVDRILTSGQTASMRRALGLASHEPLTPPYGRPFALGRARLELLPSGNMAGGAQLLVEMGSWRGLYAAGVCPRAQPGAEPAQVRACDELVLEAPAMDIVEGEEPGATKPGAKLDRLVALGLVPRESNALPTVDELTRFALDCGARRVHVRTPARHAPQRHLAGAAALITALQHHSIVAELIGPSEQLSLFPDVAVT